MTKYSKIKKSSFAILALSLILVAILAFGGTYAYFSDSASLTGGSVTTGTLTLGADTTITINEDSLVPNQTVKATAAADIDLTGNTVAAVRITLSDVQLSGGQSPDASKLTVVVSGANWKKLTDGSYYYTTYVSSLEDIVASADVSISLDKTAGNEWQGVTATFSITIEAEQAEFHETLGGTAITAGTAIDEAKVASLFA